MTEGHEKRAKGARFSLSWCLWGTARRAPTKRGALEFGARRAAPTVQASLAARRARQDGADHLVADRADPPGDVVGGDRVIALRADQHHLVANRQRRGCAVTLMVVFSMLTRPMIGAICP